MWTGSPFGPDPHFDRIPISTGSPCQPDPHVSRILMSTGSSCQPDPHVDRSAPPPPPTDGNSATALHNYTVHCPKKLNHPCHLWSGCKFLKFLAHIPITLSLHFDQLSFVCEDSYYIYYKCMYMYIMRI